MKRTTLLAVFALVLVMAAVPTFACGHCQGFHNCVEDTGSGACGFNGSVCFNMNCLAPGDGEETPMLTQYSVAVEVAHNGVKVQSAGAAVASAEPVKASPAVALR
jgi:hypothetical protein